MSIKNGDSTYTCKFLESCTTYDEADSVIVGVPMDFTCSFRPGARFGPQKIREVSIGIEDYSVYQDASLRDISFFDTGDIDLPLGDVPGSLERISKAAREIVEDGKIPVFLGGEHLISTPVIKEVYSKYGDELIILHFDAHADLREDYLGCLNSHATAIRRVCDFLPSKNIYQFGIRSGTREEFLYAEKNTNMYKFEVLEPLKNIVESLKGKPVYVTLDIDVVDPAFANGTGTPEPGGISSKKLFKSLMLLKGLNIIGFDVVEVSPPYDASDRTALLAAKVVRELLLLLN